MSTYNSSTLLYYSLSSSLAATSILMFFLFFFTDCHPIASKQDLFRELADIGNWHSLCTYLKVPEAVINGLENENLEKDARKQKCLSAYIDQGEACWEKVIEVIAGHPFYNKNLASQIAKKYGVSWQE